MATTQDGVIVVTPSGIATMTRTVRQAVLEVKAPEQLAVYTSEELIYQLSTKGLEATKEQIKHMIEFEIESEGGLEKINQMSPAELKALADRAVAHIPQPVGAH